MIKLYTFQRLLLYVAFLLAMPRLRAQSFPPVTRAVAVDGPACGQFITQTTSNGLGGNSVNEVVVVGDTVYAATNGGLSISTNGGKSFTNKTTENGLASNRVDQLVVLGSTVYALTGQFINISTDKGANFTYKPFVDENLPVTTIFDLAVVEGVIYVASSYGLSASYDGGDTYQTLFNTSGAARFYVLGLFIDNNVIYLPSSRGLLASSDGFSSFTNLSLGKGLTEECGGEYIYDNYVYDVYVNENGIYSATCDGLNISHDGGATFENKNAGNGLNSSRINRVFALGNTIYAATFQGLYISTDDGDHFELYTTSNGLGNSINSILATSTRVFVSTSSGLSLCPIPPSSDLTPIITLQPSTQYGTTTFSLVVDVYELNSVETDGSFAVHINKDPKVALSFPPQATEVGGKPITNSAWSFDNTNEDFYILTATQPIAAGAVLSFGLTGILTPGSTSGSLSVIGLVLPNTLVEATLVNNSDADRIEFFQQ